MNIQIVSESKEFYNNLNKTYQTSELQCGKHSILREIVLNSDNTLNHVRVIVQNTMNRAWQGLSGKLFSNLEDAVKNYKTPEIKAMITHEVRS